MSHATSHLTPRHTSRHTSRHIMPSSMSHNVTPCHVSYHVTSHVTRHVTCHVICHIAHFASLSLWLTLSYYMSPKMLYVCAHHRGHSSAQICLKLQRIMHIYQVRKPFFTELNLANFGILPIFWKLQKSLSLTWGTCENVKNCYSVVNFRPNSDFIKNPSTEKNYKNSHMIKIFKFKMADFWRIFEVRFLFL